MKSLSAAPNEELEKILDLPINTFTGRQNRSDTMIRNNSSRRLKKKKKKLNSVDKKMIKMKESILATHSEIFNEDYEVLSSVSRNTRKKRTHNIQLFEGESLVEIENQNGSTISVLFEQEGNDNIKDKIKAGLVERFNFYRESPVIIKLTITPKARRKTRYIVSTFGRLDREDFLGLYDEEEEMEEEEEEEEGESEHEKETEENKSDEGVDASSSGNKFDESEENEQNEEQSEEEEEEEGEDEEEEEEEEGEDESSGEETEEESSEESD